MPVQSYLGLVRKTLGQVAHPQMLYIDTCCALSIVETPEDPLVVAPNADAMPIKMEPLLWSELTAQGYLDMSVQQSSCLVTRVLFLRGIINLVLGDVSLCAQK